jgi:hypothetical protein
LERVRFAAAIRVGRPNKGKTMPREFRPAPIREAVGVFDTAESLEDAIEELQSSGFDRAELSLLASEHAVEEKLGHAYNRVEELEDETRVPRTAFVSTESRGDAEGGLIGGLMYVGAVLAAGGIVASGGTLAGAVVAAVLAGGAGAAAGSAFAKLLEYHHADYLAEQLGRGGILLWVRTQTAEREMRALEILGKHSAHDVHVHTIPAQTLELPAADDLARALLDPAAVFDEPEEVLRREDLTREQKILILRRWEYDARELETASDEGMRGESPEILDRVLNALRALRE